MVNVIGTSINDTIQPSGVSAGVVGLPGAGADSILAGTGDDSIDGGLGQDTIDGGDGIDRWTLDDGTLDNLTVTQTGAAAFTVSNGTSAASVEQYTLGVAANSTVRLESGVDGQTNIVSAGTGSTLYLDWSDEDRNSVLEIGYYAPDNITGTLLDEDSQPAQILSLTGFKNSFIDLGSGNDQVISDQFNRSTPVTLGTGSGDDTVKSSGNDTLDGGPDNDVFNFTSDGVFSSDLYPLKFVANTIEGGVSTFEGVLHGSVRNFEQYQFDTYGDATIYGGNGNDYISLQRSEHSIIHGGKGDDTISGDGTITWSVGDGNDTIYFGNTYTIVIDLEGFDANNPDEDDWYLGPTEFYNYATGNILKVIGYYKYWYPRITCFYPGTLIRTPSGVATVERLRPGDLVLTADGLAAPVRWMGRQTVSTRFADPLRVLPIRIRAGALGEAVPSRDLLLSPDHALLVGGVLIQAGALVNGSSVVREHAVPERFTYWHVELADHALILAEDTPAETFIDNVDRMAFDNWAERETLAEAPPMAELPLPRAKSARQLPQSVRVLLAARLPAAAA